MSAAGRAGSLDREGESGSGWDQAAGNAASRERGLVSPWWILGVFALAVAVALARAPEWLTASGLLLLFGIGMVRHPANGVAALLLASAFLLGEHKTPHFNLLQVGVAATLLSVWVWRIRSRVPFAAVYVGLALLWGLACVVALPVNLRDLLEDLWVFGTGDWMALLIRGIPDASHVKYLERVTVVGLSLGLFVVATQPWCLPAVLRALRPLALLVAALSTFGLLRFFGLVETAGQYLTLSFWTWRHPDLRLTAVAWNPDYFAQFLVLTLPLVLTLVWVGARPLARVAAATATVGGGLALLLTFQRAAYVSLVVGLGILVLLHARHRTARPRHVLLLVAAGAAVVLAGVVLDATVLQGRVLGRLGRLVEDPNRLRLWGTAWRMALDHPWLGVGTGGYAFFFGEYADPAWRQAFGPFWGTAHSTSLHVLAEQGLTGLLSFWLFFGGVWLGTWRRLSAIPEARQVWLMGLLAALAGWLAYSLVQFTFRVNALVYVVAILAGTAVALAPPPRRAGFSRWWLVAAAAVVLTVRAEAGLRRPVSPGYEAGFHRWERQADDRPARWTGARAAMTARVEGRVLELRIQAPIPGLERRPQTIRIYVDRDLRAALRLDGPGWQTVAIPVSAAPGSHVLIEFQAAYTAIPRQLTGSRDERELGVMVGEAVWRDP